MSTVTELSSRCGNGVRVALFWLQSDNTVVVVVEHCNGERFRVHVDATDNALDVFHHPYAYAAHRRVDHLSPARGQDIGIAA
jgi:hypothetical protein